MELSQSDTIQECLVNISKFDNTKLSSDDNVLSDCKVDVGDSKINSSPEVKCSIDEVINSFIKSQSGKHDLIDLLLLQGKSSNYQQLFGYEAKNMDAGNILDQPDYFGDILLQAISTNINPVNNLNMSLHSSKNKELLNFFVSNHSIDHNDETMLQRKRTNK